MTKNIFILINLCLLTLGIYFGVELFYQVLQTKMQKKVPAAGVQDRSGADVSKSSGRNRNRQEKASFNEYQAIVSRDLFKTAASATAGKPEPDRIELDKLEETDLNLELWGTVTGSSGRDYAVIEDKSKREQGLYHKGDTIQEATIKMILRKKVVLRVDGKDEILVMEDEKGSRRRRTASAASAAPSRRVGPANGENIRLQRSEINSVLNNINSLMQQAKVRPYFKDGQPSGLLLTHIRQNSIFTELGLQSGDIVKGVNGKDIKSVDDALEFYNNLKSSSSVELQIERRGQTKSISYQIF
jgi:general secretion pathway protein C